ncbi:MAG: hypothetical protein HQM03_18710 [Magnetococcales bacterium]|nr:hypothetical protein [Magnetococcales bacterium]
MLHNSYVRRHFRLPGEVTIISAQITQLQFFSLTIGDQGNLANFIEVLLLHLFLLFRHKNPNGIAIFDAKTLEGISPDFYGNDAFFNKISFKICRPLRKSANFE